MPTHDEIAWRAYMIWWHYREYAKRAGYGWMPDANWCWREAERERRDTPPAIEAKDAKHG